MCVSIVFEFWTTCFDFRLTVFLCFQTCFAFCWPTCLIRDKLFRLLTNFCDDFWLFQVVDQLFGLLTIFQTLQCFDKLVCFLTNLFDLFLTVSIVWPTCFDCFLFLKKSTSCLCVFFDLFDCFYFSAKNYFKNMCF